MEAPRSGTGERWFLPIVFGEAQPGATADWAVDLLGLAGS